ncbi:LPXTG cell wall anchor domain-containing protein [Thiolapillus sp.]
MIVPSTGTRGLVLFLLLGAAGLVFTGWWLWKETEGI